MKNVNLARYSPCPYRTRWSRAIQQKLSEKRAQAVAGVLIAKASSRNASHRGKARNTHRHEQTKSGVRESAHGIEFVACSRLRKLARAEAPSKGFGSSHFPSTDARLNAWHPLRRSLSRAGKLDRISGGSHEVTRRTTIAVLGIVRLFSAAFAQTVNPPPPPVPLRRSDGSGA